jgi:hypothetical protein
MMGRGGSEDLNKKGGAPTTYLEVGVQARRWSLHFEAGGAQALASKKDGLATYYG